MTSVIDKVETVPSANKSPNTYDKYNFTLEDFYRKIAQKALRETDESREQALTQLRHLIKNDSRIITCRTDALFLLRFLRVRKYNVTEAHAMLHRHIKTRQIYPHWYQNLDVNSPRIIELLDLGVITPLRKRDSKGRQIWIYEVGSMDPGKHCSTDFFRLQELMYQTQIDDEETQIAGFVFVFNYKGMTVKHAMMFNIFEFKNHISIARNTIPLRVQEMLVLNLPLVLQAFYEATKLVISPKLRKRFQVFKGLEELATVIDIECFPEKYGGKEKQEDLIADFKRKMYLKRDKIKALDEMTVDLSTNSSKD